MTPITEKLWSVEAEQQVLGAVLLNQDRVSTVAGAGGARLFHDPTHADIFKAVSVMDRDERLVSPVTVATALASHEGLLELGGGKYLASLAGAAISPNQVASYVSYLEEQKSRRDILEIVEESKESLAAGDVPPSVIAGRLEASLMALEASTARSGPVSITAAVTKALDDVSKAYQGDLDNVVKTGIRALDSMIVGFSRGEFILLGGRPSMGKTAAALSIALNASRAGHGVVIASLEMTPQAMAQRALSEATSYTGRGVAYRDMRSGSISEEEYRRTAEVARDVASLPIQFLPHEYTDLGALYAGVKLALKRLPEDKPPLVVIDYLQLLKTNARSRIEQITEISITLKQMAMRLDVPILALSQLSRALESREEKRPMLSDLRESGQLEQDADSVIFAYRDEYYLEREEPDEEDIEAHDLWEQALIAKRNSLELIVGKQRQGPVGTAHVRCNPALNLIWENDQ